MSLLGCDARTAAVASAVLFPALVALMPALFACSRGPDAGEAPDASAPSADAPSDAAVPGLVAAPDAGTAPDGEAPASPDDDPMATHLESKEFLLALFSIKRPPKRDSNADGFLAKTFGTDGPARINQGNKALAKHAVSKSKCLAGLAGLTLQSDAQKATCGGFENMVPLALSGKKPKACIDIFEFPNRPCELPMVWTAPVQAKVTCELQGKRLCSQEEWVLACRGDPDGGKGTAFAYGEDLDLEACNTNKSAATYGKGCNPDSASSAWKTCSTNTEPSGAFPRCRSRFGVFDQHGNVAEIMTRRDPDGHTYSQLKGSAFFYVDVARKPNARPEKETYPDHCAHDPRWHVELMTEAWHVNYHLGFRCCKTVR